MSKALAPLTGGLSQVVGNFILSDTVQDVAGSLEDLAGSIMGAPADIIESAFTGNNYQNYAKNVDRVSQMAKANFVDTTRLNSAMDKVHQAMKSKVKNSKAIASVATNAVTTSVPPVQVVAPNANANTNANAKTATCSKNYV